MRVFSRQFVQGLCLSGAVLAIASCAAAPLGVMNAPEAAQSAARWVDLRARIEAGVNDNRYPGAVFAISRGEHLLALEAVGVADTGTGTPMRPDSVFSLMSMTKPVTATAVMILVQEGRLDLDAPVSMHLPEFAGFGVEGGPALTLRHLLTHTSGIGFGTLPMTQATLAERVQGTSRRTLRIGAGRQWAYSGVEGPDVAARVVEVVSGQPFDQFVQSRIFDPLGMKDTAWVLDEARSARLVELYEAKDGQLAPPTGALPQLTYPSGGAGLFSTAADYSRLARMLANDGVLDGRRILEQASVEEMRRDQLGAGFSGLPNGVGAGLLMRVVLDPAAAGSPLPAGAYGWSGAYGTHFWVDPATGLSVVWMINLSNAGGAGSADALEFERLVTAACATGDRCAAR